MFIQVGYYTSNSKSAKQNTPTFSKDLTSESVKQIKSSVQKEPESVKQKDFNDDSDDLNLANKIDKSATFLKRTPNPESVPAKRFRTKPSEAELQAIADVHNMFKDKRTYDHRQNVFPGLFDNLDYSIPFIHHVITCCLIQSSKHIKYVIEL